MRTYRRRSKNVFCEDDALRLNNKEVNQLVEVSGEAINALLAKSIVFLWADLRSKALVEQSLSCHFGENRNK